MIMSVRKSKNKLPISFRLPEELEDDFEACTDTGAEQTEIIVEALRRELPKLREEYRVKRLAKMGIGAPPSETPKKTGTLGDFRKLKQPQKGTS